jgi:hypothetical protein
MEPAMEKAEEKWVDEVLSKEQVQLAQNEIHELHPIRLTPLDISFPVIFWPWGALKRCWKGDQVIEENDLTVGLLNAGGLMDKFANSNDPKVKKRLAAK